MGGDSNDRYRSEKGWSTQKDFIPKAVRYMHIEDVVRRLW